MVNSIQIWTSRNPRRGPGRSLGPGRNSGGSRCQPQDRCQPTRSMDMTRSRHQPRQRCRDAGHRHLGTRAVAVIHFSQVVPTTEQTPWLGAAFVGRPERGSQRSVCTALHPLASHPRPAGLERRRRIWKPPTTACEAYPEAASRGRCRSRPCPRPVDRTIPPVKVPGAARTGNTITATKRGPQRGLGERSARPRDRRPSRCSCRAPAGLDPVFVLRGSASKLTSASTAGLGQDGTALVCLAGWLWRQLGQSRRDAHPSGPRRTLEGVANAGLLGSRRCTPSGVIPEDKRSRMGSDRAKFRPDHWRSPSLGRDRPAHEPTPDGARPDPVATAIGVDHCYSNG